MGGAVELWRVGTLHRATACLVDSWTVDKVFRVDDMLALRHDIEVIVRGVIAWRAVGASVIATHLIDGFQTGGTLVYDLYEIVVTVCLDGDTDIDPVAYG